MKERALETIALVPGDGTLDDIGYLLYVVEAGRSGLDALDRGECLTQEHATEVLGPWLEWARSAGFPRPAGCLPSDREVEELRLR